MNKWQKDKQKLLDDAERLGNDNYTASVNSSSSNAANEKSGKKYDFTPYPAVTLRLIQVKLKM